MKKLILALLPIFLLTSCGQKHNESTDNEESSSEESFDIDHYYYDRDVVDENDFEYEHKLQAAPQEADSYFDVMKIVDYHAFYKMPSFDIKLTTSFAETINKNEFIGEIYWRHSELVNGVMGIDGQQKDNTTWHIEFELYENAKNSYSPAYFLGSDLAYAEPLNDGVTYTNTFASDDASKPALTVYSSQQLWYGIEHGYKVEVMKDSPAEKYYTLAKTLLNDIISPNDSELTKIRNLFEYITHHIVYDYGALSHDTGIANATYPDRDAATDKCYYLEGFFDNGVVVCDGFAKTYTLLGRMVGLDIYRAISGHAGDPTNKDLSGHAYCYVNYNDHYYTCCPTWSQVIFDQKSMVAANHYTYMTFASCLSPYDAVGAWEFIGDDSFIEKQSQFTDELDEQGKIFTDLVIDETTYVRAYPSVAQFDEMYSMVASKPSGSYLGFKITYSSFQSTFKTKLVNGDLYYRANYLNNNDIEILIMH